MFTHCNTNFKSHETWFLKDNENFTRRKFYLGTCPICKKGLALLVETRILDGEIFRDAISGARLEKLMPVLINDVESVSYTHLFSMLDTFGSIHDLK